MTSNDNVDILRLRRRNIIRPSPAPPPLPPVQVPPTQSDEELASESEVWDRKPLSSLGLHACLTFENPAPSSSRTNPACNILPDQLTNSFTAPKLGPALDFEDELGRLIDVTQLATDLATGQFSVVASSQPRPSIPASPPNDPPYISPAWLPSFIKHFVALGNLSVSRSQEDPRGPQNGVLSFHCIRMKVSLFTVARCLRQVLHTFKNTHGDCFADFDLSARAISIAPS